MSLANWTSAGLPLVVDLDDSLVATDSLYETFWAACSTKWCTPLIAISALTRGPLALKQQLAEITKVNPALLPYNEEVLDLIRSWRAGNGRVVLVTASVQTTADAVAKHLDLFDEAYGSGGGINLKGTNKARFLQEKFGPRGYIYIGDAPADLPVWDHAMQAVTVNATSALRARVDAMAKEVTHLSSSRPTRPADYLRLLRPHQWLKNLLIFVPMLAAHQMIPATVFQSLLAFIAFSLVASSSYVLNDLLDLAADRAHPRKRSRPLASGAVKIAHGTWMAPMLWLLGSATALLVGPMLLAIVTAYFAMTTAYSFQIKRIVVADIVMLAVLYTMRILAGSIASGVPASVWLLAFSTFFFFSLASVKRQAELVDGIASGTVRAQGRGYRVDDLAVVRSMAVSAGLISVLVLALYADSAPVRRLYTTPEVLWGICIVLLYWNSRIAILTHRGQMHDDPLIFAASDRTSHCCLLLVGAMALAGCWL